MRDEFEPVRIFPNKKMKSGLFPVLFDLGGLEKKGKKDVDLVVFGFRSGILCGNIEPH